MVTITGRGHNNTTPKNSNWRVVDIVVAAVIAVSSGVIFWAWNSAHHVLDFLFIAFPPSSALMAGHVAFPGRVWAR